MQALSYDLFAKGALSDQQKESIVDKYFNPELCDTDDLPVSMRCTLKFLQAHLPWLEHFPQISIRVCREIHSIVLPTNVIGGHLTSRWFAPLHMYTACMYVHRDTWHLVVDIRF